MRNMLNRPNVLLIALLMALMPAATVIADDIVIEAYFGSYQPAPDVLDGQSTFGIGFGHIRDSGLGFKLNYGSFDTDVDLGEELVNTDLDSSYLDLSAEYYFMHDKALSPMAFVGVGWAWQNFQGDDPGNDFDQVKLGDDSFTANFGVGLEIALGQFYLLPEVRGRWFNARDDDPIDWEGLLKFGIKF